LEKAIATVVLMVVSAALSSPMRSRNDIGRFLNRRGLLSEGVEVGVARGDFCRVILDSWQGKKLHLVDCWTPQDRFGRN